jgi:hypothetical protein
MFQVTNLPILRSTLTVYTAFGTWWQQFHLNRATGRQQCRHIVPKAVYTVKSAPEDG